MGYKEAKEGFVSGQEGGTVTRINAVCLTAITSYALWTVVSRSYLDRAQRTRPPWQLAVVDFALLVVPLVLALTVLSSRPFALNASIVVVTLVLHLNPPRSDDPPLSPMPDKVPRSFSFPPLSPAKPVSSSNPKDRLFSKPFITSYRAIMMVMTVICILAVDFPVYPREFAKAETWGTSVMDLGVGSFVFSLGVVSALPLLRQMELRPYFISVSNSLKRSVPIIVLGLVRVAMVKGVDYPEHVTEYGVHWNFFFTMALIPVFGAALERLSTRIDLHWVGLIVSCLHQATLSGTALQSWTLDAARTSLVSQNKEGLVSFPGYLAIHVLGVATGLYVLPPDPSYHSLRHLVIDRSTRPEVAQRLRDKRANALGKDKPVKVAEVLGSYATANLTYVLWVVAFNTTFLFLYLVIDLVANRGSSSPSNSKHHRPFPPFDSATSSSSSPNPAIPSSSSTRIGLDSSFVDEPLGAPALFEAINKNGLVVFLVANVLTGLINVSIETMYSSDFVALVVLGSYLSVVLGIAWVLRDKRIKI
ncbi:hypothetical protein JCM10212_004226 [Sporobolomyces blumeae]